MKVRWRQHEFILVTLFAIMAACTYLFRLFNGASFAENARFYKDILWLEYITLIIQYGCYVWLNKFIIPKLFIPKDKWKAFINTVANGKGLTAKAIVLITLKCLWLLLQFLVIIYLLGPVSNFAAYFYTQHFPDKGILNGLLTVLLPHPQEFYNMFGGFGITLFFVSIYLIYIAFREAIIYYIERPEGRRQFRILITNQVSTFAILYLAVFVSIMLFSSRDGSHFMGQSTLVMYFMVIPATLVAFNCNIYWLFPLAGNKPLLKSGITGRLLITSFIFALPVIFLQRAQLVGIIPFLMGGWAFQLFTVVPLSWLIYKQRKDKILALKGTQEELIKSKAGLQFLRSQVNPHFLFNALNTLYGTALQEGSDRTAEGIQKLGDMMRFMLHENNLDFIPMSREIEYLENYIALQKLRTQLSPGIVIGDNIGTQQCTHQIAPMLLIPLVENAFKHGISLQEKSWINITLICTPNNIQFEVRNSMHPQRDSDPEKNRSGVGLKNVEERLALLYPGKHSFSANGNGTEFVAILNIQP